jgi:hypothetical protein
MTQHNPTHTMKQFIAILRERGCVSARRKQGLIRSFSGPIAEEREWIHPLCRREIAATRMERTIEFETTLLPLRPLGKDTLIPL